MTTIAPSQTNAQRMDALAKANRIREGRALAKRSLAQLSPSEARARADTLLTCPHPDLEGMRVSELLKAIPNIGESRLRWLLLSAGVSPSKTLGGLSDRQRQALTEELHRGRRASR